MRRDDWLRDVQFFVLNLFVLGSLLGFAHTVFGASFPCDKAKSTQEKLICSDPELSGLDGELGDVYQRAILFLKDHSKFRDEQRTWLKEWRDRCVDVTCLIGEYRERIRVIIGWVVAPTAHTSNVDSLTSVGSLRYLATISDAPRASHGVYYLDLKAGKVKHLIGGFSGVGEVIWQGNEYSWRLVGNSGLGGRGYWQAYGVLIIPPDNDQSVPIFHSLVSVVQDGVSGWCGATAEKAESIERAGEILGRRLTVDSSGKGFPLLVFDIRELDCKTRGERTYSKTFRFTDGTFKELP